MKTTIAKEKTALQISDVTEKDLARMAKWLRGDWDNVAQTKREIVIGVAPEERRIRYAMRYTEINAPAITGRLFAIENFTDGQGFDSPITRVSLHRFMLNDDENNIIHEILFLKDKAFRKNLIGNLQPLEDITEDDIRLRPDCRLYWRWTGDRFEGATKKGACITNSYTDRNILVEGYGVLEQNRLSRHDRNFELTGEEISRPGYQEPEVFDRITDHNP